MADPRPALLLHRISFSLWCSQIPGPLFLSRAELRRPWRPSSLHQPQSLFSSGYEWWRCPAPLLQQTWRPASTLRTQPDFQPGDVSLHFFLTSYSRRPVILHSWNTTFQIIYAYFISAVYCLGFFFAQQHFRTSRQVPDFHGQNLLVSSYLL